VLLFLDEVLDNQILKSKIFALNNTTLITRLTAWSRYFSKSAIPKK